MKSLKKFTINSASRKFTFADESQHIFVEGSSVESQKAFEANLAQAVVDHGDTVSVETIGYMTRCTEMPGTPSLAISNKVFSKVVNPGHSFKAEMSEDVLPKRLRSGEMVYVPVSFKPFEFKQKAVKFGSLVPIEESHPTDAPPVEEANDPADFTGQI